MNYELTINKYRVSMIEHGKSSGSRANVVIASSEQEAIEICRKDKWFYDEGTGYQYKKLCYPLTFKAEVLYDR